MIYTPNMVKIDAQELKAVLLPIAEDVRGRMKNIGLSNVATAHYAAKQEILETLLLFLNQREKGEQDNMVKLQNDLATQIIRIEEIAPRQRQSELEDRLVELTKGLRPGDAALINPEQIKFGHLSAKISVMKSKKKIPDTIRVMKRGESYYIANVTV